MGIWLVEIHNGINGLCPDILHSDKHLYVSSKTMPACWDTKSSGSIQREHEHIDKWPSTSRGTRGTSSNYIPAWSLSHKSQLYMWLPFFLQLKAFSRSNFCLFGLIRATYCCVDNNWYARGSSIRMNHFKGTLEVSIWFVVFWEKFLGRWWPH